MLLSGLAYKYKCGGCNTTYYGKNKHHYKLWFCEQLGISHLSERGKDWQQQTNGDARTPLLLTTLYPLKNFSFWPTKVMF